LIFPATSGLLKLFNKFSCLYWKLEAQHIQQIGDQEYLHGIDKTVSGSSEDESVNWKVASGN
jgi:hypothetical protein